MDKVKEKILVIGGGLSGVHTCKKLLEKGLEVTLIDEGEGMEVDPCYREDGRAYFERCLKTLKDNSHISIREATSLKSIKGEAGAFEVVLSKEGGEEEDSFGAIVAAIPYSYEPIFPQWGLSPSPHILSTDSAEREFSSSKGKGEVFVFLMDFEQETNPISFKRSISLAKKITKAGGRAFIITRYAKVACPGMEKLVSEAKQEGIIIIKSPSSPSISLNGTIRVQTYDTILERSVEIEADKVVVEDRPLPGPSAKRLAQLLMIHQDPSGFLQTNNVRRVPIFTNRKGIFVSGTAAGIKPFYQVLTDGLNVALEACLLAKGESIYGAKTEIEVDTEKCARCLTCYRVCPHGAVAWNGERIVISPLMCEGCGTCASECPMNAIQLKEFADSAVSKEIGQKITPSSPVVIGFCCQNSAFEACEEAVDRGELPGEFSPIKVPCAGKVDVEYIMEALVKGAQGVVIAGCHPGNCRSERGNTFASYRIEAIRKLLKEIGIDPGRVEFIGAASNEWVRFVTKIKEFIAQTHQSH